MRDATETKIAQKETKIFLLKFTLFICLIFGLGVLHAFYPKLVSFLMIVALSILIGCAVKMLFNFIYTEKLETIRRKKNPTALVWQRNTGSVPPDGKVHVVYESGKVAWRIDPKKINWSLDSENPIREYKSCNESIRTKFRI